MEIKGKLCGVGKLPWDDRRTGETVERDKISISDGESTDLPKLFDVTETAVKEARALPFGSAVVARATINRYNQLVISSVARAG